MLTNSNYLASRSNVIPTNQLTKAIAKAANEHRNSPCTVKTSDHKVKARNTSIAIVDCFIVESPYLMISTTVRILDYYPIIASHIFYILKHLYLSYIGFL